MHYATIVNVAPEWRLATAKELEDCQGKGIEGVADEEGMDVLQM